MLQDFRSQRITWDKANNNIYEKIEAHEGDSNGRKLIVQVLNDGIVEDLTGASLSLAWQTKDKANYGLDAFEPVDLSQGLYEISYTAGMLSNAGVLKASLVLAYTTGRLESKSLDITVNKTNVDDEAVQSDNSFTALTEALVTVNQYDARIAANTQDIINLDTKTMSHLAESVTQGNPHGIDAKANKQQEDWIKPTLVNGWVETNTNLFPLGYMKDELGYVHLRGFIQGGTMDIAFTLPEDYRPKYLKVLVGVWYTNDTSWGAARVSVDTTGKVSTQVSSGYISFDGIIFDTK